MLRITAPVQFGRRHVAPIVSAFLNEYPDVGVELSLNDRNLDLIEEGLDLAVRIGPLADSSLVARQVGSVRRVVVASLQAYGYNASTSLNVSGDSNRTALPNLLSDPFPVINQPRKVPSSITRIPLLASPISMELKYLIQHRM